MGQDQERGSRQLEGGGQPGLGQSLKKLEGQVPRMGGD